MSSSGALLFFTALCLSALQIQAGYVTIDCTKENIGVFGQQSMLECVSKFNGPGEYPKIKNVTWMKAGAKYPVLKYENEKLEHSSRHSFADPLWNENNMNLSLLITNTEITDEGKYTCIVITTRGSAQNTTSLKLKAKYEKPTIILSDEKIHPNDEKTLICNTSSGYPRGELRWFSENDEWTKSAKMEVNKMDNGLFNLTSRLSLLPGSTLPKYTCVVYNANGSKEDSDTIEMQPQSSEMEGERKESTLSSKIVAPLVTIGSLIVGLLLVLVFRKKLCQRKENPDEHLKDYTRDEDIEEGVLQKMRTDDDTNIKS